MFLCLMAGQVIRRRAKFRISDVRPVNIIILTVSLPALILAEVPGFFRQTDLSTDLLFAVAMPWIHFLVAAGFVLFLARCFSWSRPVTGALILTCGLGNTSFIGLPVVEALYGQAAVRIALLLDQLGSFLILATLGLIVASIYSGKSVSPRMITKRIFKFPPFLAFLLACAWGVSPFPTVGLATVALQRMGATLVPLALLSVGWQLELSTATLQAYWKKLGWGLVFKLILWPLCTMLLLRLCLAPASLVLRVTVIEAAMATMITSAVVATEFDLDGELAQLMVGVSILFSIVTLPVWAFLLRVSS